ncbi:MAG: glycosyltransferase [Candidatus Eisenbacteria bacterium]
MIHLIASNFVGGPEKQILEHAVRMMPYGVACEIVVFQEPESAGELLVAATKRGVPVRELRSAGAIDPRVVTRLVRLIREEEAQILFAHGYKANVVGRIATGLVGTPHVAVSRGWTYEDRRVRGYERLDRLILRWANHVVAVSPSQGAAVVACGVKRERVSVVNNAIDAAQTPARSRDDVRSSIGVPEGLPLILGVGRLSPEKGFADLIRVEDLLRRDGVDSFLAILGEGRERGGLERQIEALGLRDRVALPGFDRDVFSVIAAADVFVLASYTEGLPNVLLEAAAAQRACVATAVGGSPDIIRDGQTGLLVPPGRPAMIAERVSLLLKDDGLRERLGRTARDHVTRNFSFEAQTEAWLGVYRRVRAMRREQGENIRAGG